MDDSQQDELQQSVLRVLNGEVESPDALVDKVKEENPTLTREKVKDSIIALLNRGVLELTLEGRLRPGRK